MSRHVAVLGAGIAGLVAAYRIKKDRPDTRVSVFEKQSRPGGWICSEVLDGSLLEMGPRSIRTKGAGGHTLALAEELGLGSALRFAGLRARRRYILHGGKVCPLPSSLSQMFLNPLTRGLPMTLLKESFREVGRAEDESIYEFFMRRFGPYVTHTFVDPLVKGIFAGDMEELSIKACFTALFEWEREYGSIVKGLFLAPKQKNEAKGEIFSFEGGLQTLTDTLANALGDSLNLDCQVVSLKFLESGVEIETKDGRIATAETIISALPPEVIGALMAPHHPEIASLLQGIPCTSVAVVNVGYEGLCEVKDGFGYLIPEKEEQDVLGVIFASNLFGSKEGTCCFTAMLGGQKRAHLAHASKEELQKRVQEALKCHLGVDKEPAFIKVSYAKGAIPQLLVGHGAKMTKLEGLLEHHFPRVKLTGNYFQGVGINDAVERSLIVSKQINSISASV